MTPSHYLVSHYIHQYFTKSTNCTDLLICFWWLTFLIYPILFIYYWELAFLHCIAKMYQSAIILLRSAPAYHLYHHLTIFSFIGIKSFLILFHWELNLLLYLHNYKLMTKSFYKSTPAMLIALYKALGLWNNYKGGKSTTY